MLIEMHQPTFVFGDQVILELKFTDRFPNWFRELVESYHLMQCGAAKARGWHHPHGQRRYVRHGGIPNAGSADWPTRSPQAQTGGKSFLQFQNELATSTRTFPPLQRHYPYPAWIVPCICQRTHHRMGLHADAQRTLPIPKPLCNR